MCVCHYILWWIRKKSSWTSVSVYWWILTGASLRALRLCRTQMCFIFVLLSISWVCPYFVFGLLCCFSLTFTNWFCVLLTVTPMIQSVNLPIWHCSCAEISFVAYYTFSQYDTVLTPHVPHLSLWSYLSPFNTSLTSSPFISVITTIPIWHNPHPRTLTHVSGLALDLGHVPVDSPQNLAICQWPHPRAWPYACVPPQKTWPYASVLALTLGRSDVLTPKLGHIPELFHISLLSSQNLPICYWLNLHVWTVCILKVCAVTDAETRVWVQCGRHWGDLSFGFSRPPLPWAGGGTAWLDRADTQSEY